MTIIRGSFLSAAWAGMAAVALGGCSSDASRDSGGMSALSDVPADEASGVNWTDYDGPGAAHYSPLKEINTSNVARLGLESYYDIDVPGNSLTTPVAVDGVLYFAAGQAVVHAVDAVTGRLLWQYDPEVAQVAGDKMRVGWGSRGIAYSNGSLFVGTMDGRLIAIDAKTGKPQWSLLTTQPGDGRYITGAPWVFNGKVAIGHGGADFSPTRGYVTVYDQKTGRQVWRFYTVPGDPSKGFENKAMEMAAKTWKGEWWKFGGGASVGNAMAYDPKFNRLYIGTGNGMPWNQKIRSPGGGDNLFLCSIIALDADTGEYIWHYQTNPGETWDYNSDMDIELADMTIGGEMRSVILHAPKNGFFYVIDRKTGKLLSAKNHVPVNWAKGIDIKTGRPVENPEARYPGGKAAVVYPSPFGAHNIEAMSFSPGTGLVYIPAMDQGRTYNDPDNVKNFHMIGHPVISNNGVGTPPAHVKPKAPTSYLIAWDPIAQKEAWRVRYPFNRGGGGTVATAGGLVFQGQAGGTFNAHDAKSGKLLWSFAAQTAVMANPISFSVKGKQYISVVAGSRFPTALGRKEGEWDYRTQQRRLLTFAIDGSKKLPPATISSTPFVDDTNLRIDAAQAAKGASLYHQSCVLCHGANAASGGAAPDLRRSPAVADRATFSSIVRDGILVSRNMPRFGELSSADAEAIRLYLLSRARESAASQKPRNGMQDAGQ